MGLRQILWTLSLMLMVWLTGVHNHSLAVPGDGASAVELSAREVFQSAYNNRYVWDAAFPGITADVMLDDGKRIYHGEIEISPELNVTVFDIANEKAVDWIQDQLQFEVIHRRSVPFAVIHQGDRFEFQATDETGMATIREIDAVSDSFYKIQNATFYQVNRFFGDIAVKVDSLKVRPIEQGYLLPEFAVTFYDPETDEIVERERINDRHVQIGDYYVLSDRTFELNGSAVWQLQLNNIELLS